MSNTRWLGSLGNALIRPFAVGRIARLDAITPSEAFSVAASGRDWPCGHKVRYPKPPAGIAVTVRTYACAAAGITQGLAITWTSSAPLTGCEPAGRRVSSTRQGATL